MNAGMKITEVLLKTISVTAPGHAVNSGCRISFEPKVRLPKQVERNMMHEGGESAFPICLCRLSHTVQTW